jgi:hypothetical protein
MCLAFLRPIRPPFFLCDLCGFLFLLRALAPLREVIPERMKNAAAFWAAAC